MPNAHFASGRIHLGGDTAIPSEAASIGNDLDCLAEPLFVFSLDGHPRGMNAAAQRLLGYDISKIANATPMSLVHPQDRSLLKSAMRTVQGGVTTKCQCRVTDLNGDLRWIEASIGYRAGHIYILARDVTERRQEEALTQAEARILKSIATGAELEETLAVICTAVEETILDTFCVIYLIDADGRPHPAATGDKAPPNFLKVIDDAAPGSIKKTNRNTESRSLLDRITTRCDQVLLAHATLPHWRRSLLSRAGAPIGIFAIYRAKADEETESDALIVDRFTNAAAIAIERQHIDLALIEARNNAEAGSRAKTQFVANMSHELRTPLNAIIGFSDLIHAEVCGPIAARYREYAADIHRAGNHLLSLINDVLDVARVEGGRVLIDRETVALDALVRETLRQIERAFPNRVAIKVSDCEGDAIMADHRAMTQILLNILSNAVKFTPPGGTIDIRVLAAEPGLRIVISDTGVGIDSENLKRIGEPFFQADMPRQRDYAGTGLGLFISRSLMIAHGGTLTIASEINRGTTVTLGFPEEFVVRAAKAP